jgi:diguanylate cyclase (GGDEF)-like protein/PAS domain S-box-containing protein
MMPIVAGMGFSGAAIMAGTLLYLASLRDIGRGLHKWAAGIALLGMHEAAYLVLAEAVSFAGFMATAMHLAGTALILAGTQSFSRDARTNPLPASALVVGVVATGLAAAFIAPGEKTAILLRLAASGILLAAASEMVRSRQGPRDSTLFVGGVLSLWAIATAVLPLLSVFPLTQGDILVDQVFGQLVAVGLIVLVLRRQGLTLEHARELTRLSGQKAEEQAAKMRRILDGLPDGVVVVDGAGRVRDFNASAEHIFGQSAADVVGRDAGMLLPAKGGSGGGAGGLIGHLMRYPDAVPPRSEPYTGVRRDGTRVPVEVTVSKADLAGEVLYIGLVRDISENLLSTRLSDFLYSLDRKVLQGRSSADLDQDICEEACAAFDLPLCALASWDGSHLVFQAVAGLHDPGGAQRALTDLAGRLEAVPDLAEAIRQGQSQVVTGEVAAQFLRMLPGRYDWVAALPLPQQGKTAGVMMAAGRDELPDADMMARLEAMAARVGAARQSMRDQRQLRLQGTAMAAAANAIFITDRSGRIEWVNDAFMRLSGYPADEVIGATPALLRSGAQDEEVYRRLWDTIKRGEVWRGEMVERRKDGSLYTVDQTVAPITDETGHIAHFVAVHEDVTERKRAEERILYLSNYDSLTRLPNRVLFRDHLYQSVSHARQTRAALAVMFIDLDRFSRVNDTLGHDVGDQLLMIVASRINAAAAPYAETIARIGGDEFAIIQSRLPNADAAAALARRVVEAVNQPTDLDGIEVRVGANVGIAIFPQDGEDPDHLIKNADMAMYRAIRSETESTFFFSNDMNDEARLRLSLEGDLRKALSQGDLNLFYQPQIDVMTRRIIGVEALLRWTHPERGPISPARFIPVAEDSGLILPIGEWVLEQALRQCREWQDDGLPQITMAVNISAVQFRQQALVKRVRDTVEACKVDAGRVELELTESMLMQDAREAVQTLSALSDLGTQLAIDDFGTGYSSLSYLKQFPVDKLKLDQSFVRHMVTDHNDAVIARATINLGHSLGLEVIAEGVETEDQYDYLRAEGCDVVQGFLFGRPMPPADLAALLRKQDQAARSASPVAGAGAGTGTGTAGGPA